LTTPIGPPHLAKGSRNQISGLTKGLVDRGSVSRRDSTAPDHFPRSVRVRY
jgi:hypothetical protein